MGTSPRFVVGIDLGTTNSAVATVDTADDGRRVRVTEILQRVGQSTVEARPLLPSAVYLPPTHELSPDPENAWEFDGTVVGLHAREHGGRVADRLITSAKSWLCHPGVDRTAPILPWGAPDDVPRQSPLQASAKVLNHLRLGWQAAHPGALLDEQEVVVTIPASFDEAARQLTLQAAAEAGLAHVTLIEEPLAVFYHWLDRHRDALESSIAAARNVLVIDVGGGTTDFTLIEVRRPPSGLEFVRVAVGDHVLLGGDNFDVALAHLLEPRLGGGAERLDAASWVLLVQAARRAKERLLSDTDSPADDLVTLPSRGSRLLGGQRTARLTRDEVIECVREGFFPRVTVSARPSRLAALREMGLPYAADAAITRHLAAFVARHVGDEGVDAVLLNGGALTPRLLSDRLLDVLESWTGRRPALLRNDALDLAVARGAAVFGMSRRGSGLRVGGGSARAYFVGVHAEGRAEAVCVVPQGLPEGTSAPLVGHGFQLLVGQPVRFDVYASTSRREARPGDRIAVEVVPDDLQRLPPIQTVVRAGPGRPASMAAQLTAGLTELGTLALFVQAGDERLKLEFDLRGDGDADRPSQVLPLPRRLDEGRALIERFYGKKPEPGIDPRDVRHLQRSLEKLWGEREAWNLALLRELWSMLWAHAARRRRSPDHERQFFMLLGYSLRPGFGAPLDAWRARQTFSLFEQGIQFHTEPGAWDQWWILWRRIAGGLDGIQQQTLVDAARPSLQAPDSAARPKVKGPKVEGLDELVRLVASLERVSPMQKVEIAGWVWTRIGTGASRSHWPIGRIGARVPVAGSAHQVVPPGVAVEWIEKLRRLSWSTDRDAAFAATMLARRTGDRARDVPDQVRDRVAEQLINSGAPQTWVALVRDVVADAAAETGRLLGDSLPSGLQLRETT